MYKTLAAAALVGTAAAMTPTTLFSWNFQNSDNTMSYYSGSMTYNYDAGYKTVYNGQPQAGGLDRSETYAFNIFAWADLTFNHEAFQAYKASYDFRFDLIDFTPYGQTVQWNRMDNGQGFGMTTYGFRDFQVGQLKTRVTENAKTCSWSAFSATSPASPKCDYNEDRKTEYFDPVWKVDANNYITSSVSGLSNYLGYWSWYSASF